MHTLKIASVLCDVHRPLTQMWFADVSRVSINGQTEDEAQLTEWRGVYNPDDYTRFGSRPDKPTAYEANLVGWPATLITVWFGRDAERCETMLVERAWLLGPDGQTVDRIAP
jgi:hypothetical protein